MECSGCTASRQALFANFDAEKVPQLSVYIHTPLACVGVTVPHHLKQAQNYTKSTGEKAFKLKNLQL